MSLSQLQYLNLLKELQSTLGMALLFITHDFGVVARMCDRVAVMYAGRIIETGPVREIFERPAHPYTQGLIGSVPSLNHELERLPAIDGQPPVLTDMPQGCRFAARCQFAESRCREAYPRSFQLGEQHSANCWRLEST